MKLMRLILIAFATLVIIASCNSNENKAGKNNSAAASSVDPDDSTKFTTIQWLDSLKDFGSVKEGEKVEILFRYRNTGDKPLIIQSVTAACGCTVPEYTQEAVMPGKEGFVKAVFNSSHQPPTVQKTVTVFTNTKGERSHVLHFIGEVKSN